MALAKGWMEKASRFGTLSTAETQIGQEAAVYQDNGGLREQSLLRNSDLNKRIWFFRFVGFLTLLVCGLFAGCAGNLKVSSARLTSDAPSVSTPTAIPTPVCGFALLLVPDGFLAKDSNFIIRNQTDWTNDDSDNTSAPPVDFSGQMIIGLSRKYSCSLNCTATPPSITSVCYNPSFIEVDYQEGGCACQPTSGQKNFAMMMLSGQCMVSVPQSNLPVSWVGP